MNKPAEDFFANLPSEKEIEKDNFDMFKEAEPEKDKTLEQAESVEKPKEDEFIENGNRRKPLRSERRVEKRDSYFQERLQEEREARIRLEEQVKLLSTQTKVEVDPDIKKLLTETKDPEEATRIFNNLISKAEQRAAEKAMENIRQFQEKGNDEVNAIARDIQDRLESIEDRYGVDLTDDTKTREEFLDFVKSIAPEDSDELPNMNAAWRYFQKTRTAPPTQTERKAAISSRGMTRSVQPVPEGKNLKTMSFDNLNRSKWWNKIIGNN